MQQPIRAQTYITKRGETIAMVFDVQTGVQERIHPGIYDALLDDFIMRSHVRDTLSAWFELREEV